MVRWHCYSKIKKPAMGARGKMQDISRQQSFIVTGSSCTFRSQHYPIVLESASKGALIQAVVGFSISTTE